MENGVKTSRVFLMKYDTNTMWENKNFQWRKNTSTKKNICMEHVGIIKLTKVLKEVRELMKEHIVCQPKLDSLGDYVEFLKPENTVLGLWIVQW